MQVPRTATPPSASAVLDTATKPLVRVVDDEPSIQALFQRMGPLGGFQVSTYTTAQDLLDSIDESRPGCLVIDLILPDKTGIELLQALAERGCHLPVVFMSGMARVSEAVKAIKLGSIDFIEKPFDVPQMLATIARAIELDENRRKDGQSFEATRKRFATLSARETEVMELIVQGAANKEVAARLGLSPKTVEVHRANVMRKTVSNSLAELVRAHVALRSH